MSPKKSWVDAYPHKYIFDVRLSRHPRFLALSVSLNLFPPSFPHFLKIDGNTFSGRFMGLLHGKSLILFGPLVLPLLVPRRDPSLALTSRLVSSSP